MNTKLCYHCFQEMPENAVICPHCGYDGTQDAAEHPLALPCGTVLGGKYIIGHVLGQGGFGITYVAQDYQTKERVAVKEFFPDAMAMRTQKLTVSAHSGEQRENFQYGKACFLDEAETLAEFIGNPNIVRVLTYFEENDTAYFAMEYIEGESLQQYIRSHGGKITWEETKQFLFPVMDALGAVHEKGIIHRDVTPDNIYIAKDGTVKLIDFGAARYSLGEKSRSLDVIIKHGFAPTEQYTRRGKQGPYTDVYALAATMYYALSGKLPPDSIERLEEDQLADLNALGVDIPLNVERAIEKAMSLRHADRFQSMAEFREALQSQESQAKPASPVKSEPAPEPGQQSSKQASDPMNQTSHGNRRWIPLVICTVWMTFALAITAGVITRKQDVRQSAIPTESTTVTVPVTTAVPETTALVTTAGRKETTRVRMAATQKATTPKVTTAPRQTTLLTTIQTTPATTAVQTTKATTTLAATTKTTTQACTTQVTTSRKNVPTKFSGRGTPNSSDGFANLRSSMEYTDNVVFPVYNGTLMSVESTDDPEWYLVCPDNSGYGGGYMKASLVELFDDLKNVKKPQNMTYLGRGTSTSADGFLNVHADPSISKGNTVDTLPNGAYGDVYSYGNKSWYYIKTATGFGYVKADFIRMLKQGAEEEIIYNSEFGYIDNPNKRQNVAKQSVQTCEMSGTINTHGRGICSFPTSYVVDYGEKSILIERLDHGLAVKAISYYRSYDVDWYELYSIDKWTYLGWVDAEYIDFYG